MLGIHIYDCCVGHNHNLYTYCLVKFCLKMNMVVDQSGYHSGSNSFLILTEICFDFVVETPAFSYQGDII